MKFESKVSNFPTKKNEFENIVCEMVAIFVFDFNSGFTVVVFYILALLWGDPHFKTLDGLDVTFNPIGDYSMLQAKSMNANFDLHARMAQPMTASGALADATAFIAFAAQFNDSAKIQIGISSDQKSESEWPADIYEDFDAINKQVP